MYKVIFPLISLILTAACGTSVPAEGLVFDPSSGKAGSIELPTGETVNYTAYEKLYFVGNPKATNAPHWYVRHGSRDRDTSFPVPVAFATKLENAGLDVDFLLAWNRPHSGDYALDEVFDWIRRITSR